MIELNEKMITRRIEEKRERKLRYGDDRRRELGFGLAAAAAGDGGGLPFVVTTSVLPLFCIASPF